MNKRRKFLSLCFYIFIMISLSMISAIALVNVIFDIEDSNQSEVVTIAPITMENIEPDTPHIDTSTKYIEAEVVYIEEESSEDTTLEESDEDASEDEPEIVEDTVDPEELEMLAITIYNEAGDMINCSDDTRLKVGNVVLNRIAHPDFPDTMYEVLTAYRQYGMFYWTGIVWADRGDSPEEQKAKENAYAIARRLLEGERVFDADVIWQAEFFQGTELVSYQDGIYFCK